MFKSKMYNALFSVTSILSVVIMAVDAATASVIFTHEPKMPKKMMK